MYIYIGLTICITRIFAYAYRVNPSAPILTRVCSADGSTHTESNKLYRKVKHQARPNISSRQEPKRAPIRRRLRRRQRRGEPHTEHGLGILLVLCM